MDTCKHSHNCFQKIMFKLCLADETLCYFDCLVNLTILCGISNHQELGKLWHSFSHSNCTFTQHVFLNIFTQFIALKHISDENYLELQQKITQQFIICSNDLNVFLKMSVTI